MNEFLIVRLSNNPTLAVQWLVWSVTQQEVIASGELANQDAIADIAPYGENRRTIVLLSASSLVLNDIAIPAGASRQLEAMLPYVMEDELAQDVDQLHFTIFHKGNGRAQVCAVDSEWLTHILQRLTAIGCQIQKVLPDVLALPESKGISAVELDGQWLLKKSTYSGISIDSEWLALVSQSDWVKRED